MISGGVLNKQRYADDMVNLTFETLTKIGKASDSEQLEKGKILVDFIKDFHSICNDAKLYQEQNSVLYKFNINSELYEVECEDYECDCHRFACDCENASEAKHSIPYRQEDYVWSPPKRWLEFKDFSDGVLEHIETYTVPQYGDYPNDQLTETSNECIVHDMKRYLYRFNTGQRGYGETMRDMLKIAHYAGVIYSRLKEKHNEC